MPSLDTGLTGRDHYDRIYNADLASEAEWLGRCATDKVDNIVRILSVANVRPESVVELGAGTGVILAELRRRGIGQNHTAIDYSEIALARLREDHLGIDCVVADVNLIQQGDLPHCDLVVACHLIEHLEDPSKFLEAIASGMSFTHLLIEVPLEDLFAGRLKARFRNRSTNSAGHVQFFTASSIERLATSSDLSIVGRRRYVPIPTIDTLKFLMRKDHLSSWKFITMLATRHVFPRIIRRFWGHAYYAHYGILCVPTLR
ncbi:MAG: SAM-dependent methyltransferase [Devosia sp.]|nr:SAM-dependent methyltransferase [Devosia sp.]